AICALVSRRLRTKWFAAHAVSRRHRRGFVGAILCLRLRRTSPLGERQAPKSGPGIPRTTAPRTAAPALTAPPTWTPGLMAPPTWADSAVGIRRDRGDSTNYRKLAEHKIATCPLPLQ